MEQIKTKQSILYTLFGVAWKEPLGNGKAVSEPGRLLTVLCCTLSASACGSLHSKHSIYSFCMQMQIHVFGPNGEYDASHTAIVHMMACQFPSWCFKLLVHNICLMCYSSRQCSTSTCCALFGVREILVVMQAKKWPHVTLSLSSHHKAFTISGFFSASSELSEPPGL